MSLPPFARREMDQRFVVGGRRCGIENLRHEPLVLGEILVVGGSRLGINVYHTSPARVLDRTGSECEFDEEPGLEDEGLKDAGIR